MAIYGLKWFKIVNIANYRFAQYLQPTYCQKMGNHTTITHTRLIHHSFLTLGAPCH